MRQQGSGEDYIKRSFTICTSDYYSHDQIKKNEMGWVRGTYVGEERYIQSFGGET
jgi:hypothetical protein